MKLEKWAVAFLAAATIAGGVAVAQDGQEADDVMARDLVVVQKPIIALKPVAPQLGVAAWVDRPDRTYAIGETVKISVRPSKNAYVTVINVGTSGATTVLFPNSASPSNYVRAGQTLTLPPRTASWAVQAQGPGGVEVIKVIASTSPNPLVVGTKWKVAGPFRSYEEAGEPAARDLAVVLNSSATTEWAESTRLIRVVPFR